MNSKWLLQQQYFARIDHYFRFKSLWSGTAAFGLGIAGFGRDSHAVYAAPNTRQTRRFIIGEKDCCNSFRDM